VRIWELNIHVYHISYYATQSDKTILFRPYNLFTLAIKEHGFEKRSFMS